MVFFLFQLTGSAASSRHHNLSSAQGNSSSTSPYHQQRMLQQHQPRTSTSQNSFTDLTIGSGSNKQRGNGSKNTVPSPDLLLNHVISKATAAAADLEMRALADGSESVSKDPDSEESNGDQDSCYHESTLRRFSDDQLRRNSLELLRHKQDGGGAGDSRGGTCATRWRCLRRRRSRIPSWKRRRLTLRCNSNISAAP